MVLGYCQRHGLGEQVGLDFYRGLQKDALEHRDEVLSNVDGMAQRLWTSQRILDGAGVAHSRELCFMINEAIRLDDAETLGPVVQLVRSINQLCVVRLKGVPVFPHNHVCFRGSGLPAEHHAFFQPGLTYRVPGLLATSLAEGVAFGFLFRAFQESGRKPVVLWRVHLDRRGPSDFRYRCKHVNLVRHSNVAGEEEYLFVPYSVFTVEAVLWRRGDDREPHVIDIRAAVDNRDHDQGPALPLAPHY